MSPQNPGGPRQALSLSTASCTCVKRHSKSGDDTTFEVFFKAGRDTRDACLQRRNGISQVKTGSWVGRKPGKRGIAGRAPLLPQPQARGWCAMLSQVLPALWQWSAQGPPGGDTTEMKKPQVPQAVWL